MIKQIFLNRLRGKRRENNLSQENMAQMLNMSASNYAKIEEGKVNVDIEKLEKIAQILEVDVVYLLGHDCMKSETK